jgi:sugar O-acyltransferase (sialic acid O-acetyltransferase NeuD family)
MPTVWASRSKAPEYAQRPILIAGSSGHASVVADCIEKQGRYHVVGCIDSFRRAGAAPCGATVLGTEADLPALWRQFGAVDIVVAVGDNWGRGQFADRIRALMEEARFPVIVHPSAQIGRNVTIGEGSVILANAVVNANASVGRFCILNTKSSLGHDSVMEDFSSLAPGATLGGHVVVGAYSAISIGACVIQGLRIGKHSVIGAGAVVVRDIPDYAVAYGNPARVQRARKAGDPYL